MEKLKMESVDLTEKNIEKIAALFPNATTETIDDKGNIKKAINFPLLKQLLSDDIVDGDECYEFTWVGKKQSIIDGSRPIRKTLRPCPGESKNWDKTENLYIEGDNLEVLKLLQGSYLNAVKMIYIDPPYNTGNDFVYRDNFAASKDDYEGGLGLYDEEENRLFKNTETNGRFHSDWCSMMYPRLQLARNLLTDDGVIFISIDDNEVHNLRNICDEIFGESGFVASFIWKRRQNVDSRSKTGVSADHEYCLVYRNNRYGRIRGGEKDLNKYSNPDNDPRGPWMSADMTGLATKDQRPNLHYDLYNKETGKTYVCPTTGWRYERKRMERLIESDEIIFPNNDEGRPRRKKFLKDLTEEFTGFSTLLSTIYNTQATRELRAIFNDQDFFDFPKPTDLIKIFVEQGASDDSSIVLDFFSGSATTAHAVMQLNAEDRGNRKFIMVQVPETSDEKSEAYKAGYKNICDIGKERIRRAGKRIEEELRAQASKGGLFKEEVKEIDTGFRVLKLDSTNMKDVYYSAGEYTQQMLLDLESNIKEDRNEMDLLYGVLLDWGVPLSLPHAIENIGGVNVHFVNDTDLVACFADDINETVIREIAKRQPLRVVFRDSSFAGSPDKINVTEIFKTISGSTTIKVI